ncbi:hypothetical protein [Gracilimonas sp.]|uniref:hypothetical protein n=1 Tax=Gracilimonas sp. TaxID=1974203 RepID=UPI002871053F|nr:hypothetical protein [Gracilimonas sp.]
MAVTISEYNQTKKKLINSEYDLTNLKVMLRNATTFTASDTVVSDLDGSEVSGNGWTAGGEAIANAAVTIVDTDDAMLDGDDIAVTATGGDIGPTDGYVIVDDTDADAELVAFIDPDGAKTAGSGTEFQVNFNADGILRVT